jgi:hypothetical protein
LARFIYPYPPFAIHDLEHLSLLSDAPDLPLYVSERSLYILQNLVDREATWASRYAVALVNGGYNRVEEEDAEYALYLACVERLQEEVIQTRMEWTEFTPHCWQPATSELDLDQVDGQYLYIHPILHWYATFVIDEAGAAGRIVVRGQTDIDPVRMVSLAGTWLMARSGLTRTGVLKPYVTDTSLWELWSDGDTGKFGQSPAFPLAVGDQFWLYGWYAVLEE